MAKWEQGYPRGVARRRSRAGDSGRAVSAAVMEWLEKRVLYTVNTYVVSTGNDSVGAPPPGSLRQAILNANAHANDVTGPDTITFALPGAGAHSITLSGALPNITDSVIVDGLSQGGAGYTGSPLIRIDAGTPGTNIGNCLTLQNVGNSIIDGLAITGFQTGIYIDNSVSGVGNNTLTGNYIGLSTDGKSGIGNVHGLQFYHSSNNIVSNNVISANGIISHNAGIYTDSDSGDVFTGNFLGTDASGTVKLGNGGQGIYLYNSSNARVGTNGDGVNDVAERNVISGNTFDGVVINGGGGGNVIAGNLIGLAVNGSTALGNGGAGISIFNGPSNNRIGTNSDGVSDALERNVIGSNADSGIYIAGGGGNTIAGNYIGADSTGKLARANGSGLFLDSSTNNRIGTNGDGVNDAAERNIVSANNGDGIALNGGSGNIIAGDYIGVDVSGTSGLANTGAGISLFFASSNNRIGTNSDGVSDTLERNIISGNISDGIAIGGGSGNIIAGNYVGFDASGAVAMGNQGAGVDLYGGASASRIGIDAAAASVTAGRNLIGNNTGAGIRITGTNNVVIGNYIGTDLTGKLARGNGAQGVVLFAGASNNQVTQNVISANGIANLYAGLEMTGANITANIVQGNFIGTDVNGTARLGNAGDGVLIHGGASGNRVGSNFDGINDAAERNIISANGFIGVEISGAGVSGNSIAGNYIGTDVTGKVALGNANQGAGILFGASGNTLDRNVIAGNGPANQSAAIELYSSATANIVIGNFIGVDATGTNAMGNGGVGIYLHLGAANNRVGTNGDGVNDAAEGNVISNSAPPGYAGIQIDGPTSSGNQISGNKIGTDSTGTRAMPNLGPGVLIRFGSFNNQIGGPSAVFGNLIANNGSAYAQLGGGHYNDAPGVVISDGGTGNSIRANSIYNNHGIGIDLVATSGFDGVTINNANNVDTGSNHLQNYPILLAATSGNATAISGLLNSTPNTTFTLDFFANAAPNASLFGDGQRYLGSATVTTNASGNVQFQLSLGAASSAAEYLTATATDPNGNTSEFSADLKLNAVSSILNATTWTPIGAAPISVLGDGPLASGRVADIVPDPGNANVMYLDADGGGIWKTTDWLDAQPVWTPLTDGESTINMGIGYTTLAVAPSNSQILYAAPTGPGAGILRSTNGGSTWTLLANALFDQALFTGIVVDPANANTLYVSLRSSGGEAVGVYKSTDGGNNWTNTTATLLGSNNTAASVTDLVMDPHDSQTLYAGITGSGALNGLYRSTNGGGTWLALPTTGGLLSGTAVGDGARIAVAPSNSQVIYAALFDPTLGNMTSPVGYPRRFVSTNGGSTWALLAAFPGLDEPRFFHLALAVDPNNPAIIYANGDHALYRSTNFGLTTAGWINIFGEDPVNVRFDQANHLLLAGDRGVYLWAGGITPFISKQGNLQNTENYTITLDPTNEKVLYAVAQDQTAALKYLGGSVWNQSLGGSEVGKVLVNPTNTLRLYMYTPAGGETGSSNNLVLVSNDGGATWAGSDTGLPAASNVAGFSLAYTSQKAFQMDPTNPHRIVVGVTQVYETSNDAANWHSITSNADLSAGHYISSVGIAASNTNAVYAATDDGKFWATTDNGASPWQERDTNLPKQQYNRVVDFKIDPANSLRVFAVTSGDRTGLVGSHAWMTTNGGVSWTDISGNLNPENWVQSIAVDWRFAAPVLYIGTVRGVYSSANLGGNWTAFGAGMPNGIVEDLQLLPNTNLLAAATYGRGVFEIRVGTPTVVAITSGNNVIIKRNVNPALADITANGTTTPVNIAQAATFAITGGAGNDTLTVDFSNGNPLPAGGVSFDGGAGVNLLSIIGTTSSDTLTLGPGGITFANGTFGTVPITAANVQSIQFIGGSGGADSLNVASGTYTVDADTAAGNPNVSVTVGAAANITFSGHQHLAALAINGGIASVVTATRKTINSGVFSISGFGKLDIGGNNLIATAATSVIRGYLQTGLTGNMDWSGLGITSSLAAGNPVTYTIGYGDSTDGVTQGLSAGQVLVRSTVNGDATLDGTVDLADFGRLSAHFGMLSGARWVDADYNYDGLVDLADFGKLSANFGAVAAAGGSTGSAASSDASGAAGPARPQVSFAAPGVTVVSVAPAVASAANAPAAVSVAEGSPHRTGRAHRSRRGARHLSHRRGSP